MGCLSVYVRGPNSLNDDLRTASRGRLPGLTSFKARSYPRDSAGSAIECYFGRTSSVRFHGGRGCFRLRGFNIERSALAAGR